MVWVPPDLSTHIGGRWVQVDENGNFYYERSSLVSLSVTARTRDGGSSGFFLRNHFDVAKLDTNRIGREAIQKALKSRNPHTLEPGIYPVILEAQAADDLIRFGFDARSADEGRSPYSAPGGKTKLGQQIFDERINVYSDPWHPELPSSPAAAGGIPAQKIHFVRNGISGTLGISADQVHAIWVVGPGSYGRSDADDAAMDAAVLAKATGRPVRVQYTRDQGTGWDPKGPASVHRARAAIDARGNVTAYEFTSKGFSRVDVNTNGSQPFDTLAGHFRGIELKSGDNFGIPAESYEFANKRTYWETIPPLLDRASPLRSSHLRDPVGPQIQFASESFMDEVAHALNLDPIEFRLRHVKDQRDIAVIKAAAEKAGWQSRPSPRRDQTGNKVSGRGIAYAQRNGTRVAIVAEVDIDRSTGKIFARKFTVAHDCGQIINPDGLKHTIEGNIIQGLSRTIWEETKFDTKSVTSIDWVSYPILDITETPAVVDIVLIDRPNVAPSGAGEPSMRPLTAAIANAIFDATGVRIRRVPFTPERVKQAMS